MMLWGIVLAGSLGIIIIFIVYVHPHPSNLFNHCDKLHTEAEKYVDKPFQRDAHESNEQVMQILKTAVDGFCRAVDIAGVLIIISTVALISEIKSRKNSRT